MRLWKGLGNAGFSTVTFAVAAPVLVMAVGALVNLSVTHFHEYRLQAIADASSTAAAREMALSGSDAPALQSVARSYALGLMDPGEDWIVETAAERRDNTVAVRIRGTVKGTLPVPGLQDLWEVDVRSVARVTGGPPVCLVALDPEAVRALYLDTSARLTAAGCSVFSNSKSPLGLVSVLSAVLKSALTCSAGGKLGLLSNFDPEPITDCPAYPDPLRERPEPAAGGCVASSKVIAATVATLAPGTYCGGLRITKGATARLTPGVYVIKDGPLTVDQGSTIEGENVGLYLLGKEAVLNIAPATTVSLTAPKDGAMAGLLIFEARSAPELREHKIMSDNAHTLLGTIYLPQGRLLVDAAKPVAANSAYTIIVVRRLELRSGPNLVLNTGYAATDVPVPKGLGPIGGSVGLTR